MMLKLFSFAIALNYLILSGRSRVTKAWGVHILREKKPTLGDDAEMKTQM